MKTFTMITRHGATKQEISAYTLISSDYQTVTISAKELASAIKAKKIVVTNLELKGNDIVGTNGTLDKYTLINTQTNQVEGIARAVILDRVEQGGKLVGYTAFTQSGTLVELSIADAVALVDKKLVSNGKIRHTAIGGNYQLREIALNKAPKGETSVDILYFAKAVGTKAEYFGAIVSCTSATEMSKLNDVLSKSNAKIVAEITKVGGNKVRESLAIKRTGANSLYGVFELSLLEKIIESGAKLHNQIGAITVSAVEYNGEDVDEATTKLNTNWKPVDGNKGNDKTTKAVTEYTKKIVEKFNKVEITK
jgi:hypothetical protein